MNHKIERRQFLTKTGLTMAGGALAMAPVLASANSTDTTALEKAAQQFLQSLDNLDWEPFVASWAANPTIFFPFDNTPERVDGKSAINARFRTFFDQVRTKAEGPPYLKLKPNNLKVERFGDAGLITFTLGGLSSVGGLSGKMGRRTVLFVLENREWKVAHLHASSAGA